MAEAAKTEIVDVPLQSFFNTVRDFASYPRFVTGMKETRIEESQGERRKIFFDMEMMKRLQYSVWATEKLEGDRGEIHWTLAESSFFKKNNGSWKLKAVDAQRTEVTYSLEVEFSFSVPGFILKGLIGNSLPMAIKEFAKEAQKRGA